MTAWDISRSIVNLRRVRALYTALGEGDDSTERQRVVYLRCLKILDQKIASAEMQLGAFGFARLVHSALL